MLSASLGFRCPKQQTRFVLIDGLQYCKFSEGDFTQMREAGVDAVHVTICYHENFRETVANLEQWNRWFEQFPHLIIKGTTGNGVRRAYEHARTADMIGIDHIGIGSDLCQDQPDSVVNWMRVGRWTKQIDYGEGSKDNAGIPPQPDWFTGNRDVSNIAAGLKATGTSHEDTAKVMGGNWLKFFDDNFGAIVTGQFI